MRQSAIGWVGWVCLVTLAAAGPSAHAAEIYWYRGFDTAPHLLYTPTGRYAVLAEHLSPMGYNFTESDASLDAANLGNYDVLVLTQNALGGTLFTQDEVDAVDAFVRDGGGLLLLSECRYCFGEDKIEQISGLFGVDVAVKQFWTDNVYTSSLATHPSLDGVSQFYMRYSASIAPGELTPIAWADHDTKVAMAVGTRGSGRVAVIADGDLFTSSSGFPSYNYYVYADNYQLSESTFGWLAVPEPASAALLLLGGVTLLRQRRRT